MSRAEEKALEEYPLDLYNDEYDWRRRAGFEKGYQQAIKDAIQWLTEHLKDHIDYNKDGSIGNFDDDALLEGFDRALM